MMRVTVSRSVSVTVAVKNREIVGVPFTVAMMVEEAAAASSCCVGATRVGKTGAVGSSSIGMTSSDVGFEGLSAVVVGWPGRLIDFVEVLGCGSCGLGCSTGGDGCSGI
jgi:hypothetical protein